MGTGRALFLEGVDGRKNLARRYREVLAELLSDLGTPSPAQIMIARRAATLSVWAEDSEARLVAGHPVDIGTFTTAANTMRRLLSDLRRPDAPRDITPGGASNLPFTVEYVSAPGGEPPGLPPTQET